MLSAKEIADRIQQPELIQKNDISFLKELSEKHPYTQIYSILYLKALGDNADIHFEQELQKHSYRIGDRSQLFKLIHDFISTGSITATGSITEATIESITEETISPIIETTKTINESIEIITPTPIVEIEIPEEVGIEEENSVVEDEIINEASEEIVEIIEKVEEKVDEGVQASENEIIEEKPLEIPADALDESILHHSFAANYQLPDLSEEEIVALEKRKIEKEKPVLIIESEAEKSTSEIEINTTQSFTSWLNSNKNKVENLNNEKLEIEAIVNNSSLTFEINEFFGEVVKPKKEFFSPVKKAKESLSEDALPVSETLAKVYALQGNFPKAIYAYEQLSLKYPEKKIFFAIQIKELQKKLNT